VAWLADRLHGQAIALRAGELVLAGSFTRPLWVHRGDHFLADYGPLGTVEFQFS
jgi:2-oxo-hept-3-ene-1,7-dioate hydratase